MREKNFDLKSGQTLQLGEKVVFSPSEIDLEVNVSKDILDKMTVDRFYELQGILFYCEHRDSESKGVYSVGTPEVLFLKKTKQGVFNLIKDPNELSRLNFLVTDDNGSEIELPCYLFRKN